MILKNILYTLLAIIAVLLYAVSVVIVFPIFIIVFLIGTKPLRYFAAKLEKIWAKSTLLFCSTWLKVYNEERLNPKETYVIVSNHKSQLDIPACASATRVMFKFLAKEELTKIPLLGFIIKNQYITVRRDSMRARVESMRKMEKALADGTSILIYPEGTRNKTNEPLAPFQDGAFHLAVSAQKPIAVLTLLGTDNIVPAGKKLQIKPGVVKAFWSEPIYTTGMTKNDVPELREKVRQLMLENIEKNS